MYNKQVNEGKRVVILIIAITNIYAWISFFISLDLQNAQTLLKQIFAIAAIMIVSFLFYKGFKLAQWLILGFLIKPVIGIIFYLLYAIGILELYNGWLMLILAIAIVIIGGTLITSQNSMNEFMKYQSEKRKGFNNY